jgi:hypothetical protein
MKRCRNRDIHWLDLVAILGSVLLILAIFALDPRVADHRQPRGLPVRVFWVGIVLGLSLYIRAEQYLARRGAPREANLMSGAAAR